MQVPKEIVHLLKGRQSLAGTYTLKNEQSCESCDTTLNNEKRVL